jgi:hypothetical protein
MGQIGRSGNGTGFYENPGRSLIRRGARSRVSGPPEYCEFAEPAVLVPKNGPAVCSIWKRNSQLRSAPKLRMSAVGGRCRLRLVLCWPDPGTFVTIPAVCLTAKICPCFAASVRPAVVNCASAQNSDSRAKRDLKLIVNLGRSQAVLSAVFAQLCCKRQQRGSTAAIAAIDSPSDNKIFSPAEFLWWDPPFRTGRHVRPRGTSCARFAQNRTTEGIHLYLSGSTSRLRHIVSPACAA